MFWANYKKTNQSRQRPETKKSGAKSPYSYYSGSPERAAHEKSVDLSKTGSRLRIIPTVLALAVIAFSLLFNLTLSASPHIRTVDGETSIYRSHEEYFAATEELLNSSVNNKTKLTIDVSEVEQRLLKRFPEIKAAALRLPVLGRRINLVLELRKPALILSSPGRSYVVDDAGRTVARLQDISAGARENLSNIKDESGFDLEVGDQAITTETVAFVREVRAQLEVQNLEVAELILPLAANQLNVQVKGLPYYIKTEVSGDARLQVGRFIAVKKDLERAGTVPSEYIDVRVEEKVFYK